MTIDGLLLFHLLDLNYSNEIKQNFVVSVSNLHRAMRKFPIDIKMIARTSGDYSWSM